MEPGIVRYFRKVTLFNEDSSSTSARTRETVTCRSTVNEPVDQTLRGEIETGSFNFCVLTKFYVITTIGGLIQVEFL